MCQGPGWGGAGGGQAGPGKEGGWSRAGQLHLGGGLLRGRQGQLPLQLLCLLLPLQLDLMGFPEQGLGGARGEVRTKALGGGLPWGLQTWPSSLPCACPQCLSSAWFPSCSITPHSPQ